MTLQGPVQTSADAWHMSRSLDSPSSPFSCSALHPLDSSRAQALARPHPRTRLIRTGQHKSYTTMHRGRFLLASLLSHYAYLFRNDILISFRDGPVLFSGV